MCYKIGALKQKGLMLMSTITVRMNKDEQEVFETYAKLRGVPLSTIMKQTLEEKIEDEFDV